MFYLSVGHRAGGLSADSAPEPARNVGNAQNTRSHTLSSVEGEKQLERMKTFEERLKLNLGKIQVFIRSDTSEWIYSVSCDLKPPSH